MKQNTFESSLTKVMPMNHFTTHNKSYALYRPSYPAELLTAITAQMKSTRMAVDVGCGTGQLSVSLSGYFDQVIAVDSSEGQLQNARLLNNVEYRMGSAEKLPVASQSADLIVAAQAAHWFDLEAFYFECQRVARADAVIALVGYGLPVLSGIPNSLFQKTYWQDLADDWPVARRHVESGYSDLYFPFEQIEVNEFTNTKQVNMQQLLGYVSTWSATKSKCRGTPDFLIQLERKLSRLWGAPDTVRDLQWPIFCRLGRLR
jgi:SAM-dependent methyltransferase